MSDDRKNKTHPTTTPPARALHSTPSPPPHDMTNACTVERLHSPASSFHSNAPSVSSSQAQREGHEGGGGSRVSRSSRGSLTASTRSGASDLKSPSNSKKSSRRRHGQTRRSGTEGSHTDQGPFTDDDNNDGDDNSYDGRHRHHHHHHHHSSQQQRSHHSQPSPPGGQRTPPVIVIGDGARDPPLTPLGSSSGGGHQPRLSEDDDLERIMPEVTAALLCSNGSLKGLSTDEAVTKLIDTAKNVLKQYHAPRTHAQLFKKYLRYPPTIPLILIILSLLSFYIYGTIKSSPYQFRISGTIVEVAILTVIVIWNAFLLRREQQLKGREVRDRVKGIIVELESIRTLGTQDLKIPTVPSVSTVRVIRSGVVKTLPSNLIVKGDLIEMVYGDVAPCRVLCLLTRQQLSRLSISEDFSSNPGDRESMATATVHSGQQPFLQPPSSQSQQQQPQQHPFMPRPSISNDRREFFLSAKEIFQSSLFGFPPTAEMQQRHLNNQGRYTFEVLETPLEKILHTALDPTPRPQSLIQKQLAAIHQVLFHRIIPGVALLAFGINLLRYVILEVIELEQASQGVEQLLVLPVHAILPLMMLSMPSLLQISKAYCNATILVLYNTLQISKTEFEDDQDVDEFDVEAPPPTKNVSIGRREVLSRFWKLLTRWGKSGREFDDGLTRSTNLVESLGGVTVICSIDKEGTIATVFPEMEQVLIATEGGDTEVLDLAEDPLSRTGVRFEDRDWSTYLPSLKPLGLNQLLNTKCEHTLSASRRHESHRKYTGLSAHGRNRAAQQTCLCRLGKEIGFTEEALQPFSLQREIFCYHPYLPSAAGSRGQGRRGGGSKAVLGSRATFEIPTMLSTIYHDMTSDGYLLLTDGHVECVVECCSDFWDGSGVQELDDAMLKKISDFYQTAILNDMQCVSYAYRPISLPKDATIPGMTGKTPYEMITLPYIDIGGDSSSVSNESRRGSSSSHRHSTSSSGPTSAGTEASSSGTVLKDGAPGQAQDKKTHPYPKEDAAPARRPSIVARAARSEDSLTGAIIIETDIPLDSPKEEHHHYKHHHHHRQHHKGSVVSEKDLTPRDHLTDETHVDMPPAAIGDHDDNNGEKSCVILCGGDTTVASEKKEDRCTCGRDGIDGGMGGDDDDSSSIHIVVDEGIHLDVMPMMMAYSGTEEAPITGTAAALAKIDAGPLRRWRHLRQLQNLVDALEDNSAGAAGHDGGDEREKGEDEEEKDGEDEPKQKKRVVGDQSIHPLDTEGSGEAEAKRFGKAEAQDEGGIRALDDNSDDDDDDDDDDANESLCEQFPTAAHEFAEHVVQGQIFLGMVTLAHQPKTNVCDFIEDLGLAGIRFVYFSPSSERESKAFADRLGLETDWNSCILLSSETDPYGASTGYLESYDIKAQLPRGIENIRPHLETTDDIPLHVSLFAECGSEAATEMIQIFQDYGEVADISVGMEPIRMQSSSDAKSTFSLGAKINSVSCGLMMQSETSLYALTQIVREARRLLNSQRQGSAFMMASFLSVSLLLVVGYCFLLPPAMTGYHILWLVWVIVPLLALSFFFTPHEPDTMTTMPSKNTAPLRALPRFIVHFLVRFTLPIAITLHIYDGREGFQFSFNSLGDGKAWLSWTASEQWALLYAQNYTLLVWVWYTVWLSGSFMSRTLPIRAFAPWKNRVWIGASIACMVLQLVFCFISLIKGPHRVSAVPWWLIVVVFLWPVVFMPIQEVAKARDRKEYIRAQKLAKLEFNTKLGMHSPL
ncbi:hypothetical protein BGZ73_002685 [Actinomortierella ambigua]|nr:hypothetical protein BGZ73_002685 [Actinomortierella ambigua]